MLIVYLVLFTIFRNYKLHILHILYILTRFIVILEKDVYIKSFF